MRIDNYTIATQTTQVVNRQQPSAHSLHVGEVSLRPSVPPFAPDTKVHDSLSH